MTKKIVVSQLPGVKFSSRLVINEMEHWVTVDSADLMFDGAQFVWDFEGDGPLTKEDMALALAESLELTKDALLEKLFQFREELRAYLAREAMDNFDL